MTREAFSPSPSYPIDGVGPYQITHPYKEGTLVVAAVLDGSRVELLESEYTVSPTESLSTGEIALTIQAAADYDTGTLYIRRATDVEQGWLGQSAREKGLEAQLDWLAEAVQDLTSAGKRTVRLDGETSPVTPKDGHVIVWEEGNFRPGPSETDIRDAQPNAAIAQANAVIAQEAVEDIANSFKERAPRLSDYGDGTFSQVNLDAMSADVGYIRIGEGMLVSADATVNDPIHYDPGAYISVNDGVTVTIEAAVESPRQYIFRRTGTTGLVKFQHDGSEGEESRRAHVSWFGAFPLGDATIDQAVFLQRAADAMGSSREGEILFDTGTYYVRSKVTWSRANTVRGTGDRMTNIWAKGAIATSGDVWDTADAGCVFRDFQFNSDSVRTSGAYLRLLDDRCEAYDIYHDKAHQGVVLEGNECKAYRTKALTQNTASGSCSVAVQASRCVVDGVDFTSFTTAFPESIVRVNAQAGSIETLTVRNVTGDGETQGVLIEVGDGLFAKNIIIDGVAVERAVAQIKVELTGSGTLDIYTFAGMAASDGVNGLNMELSGTGDATSGTVTSLTGEGLSSSLLRVFNTSTGILNGFTFSAVSGQGTPDGLYIAGTGSVHKNVSGSAVVLLGSTGDGVELNIDGGEITGLITDAAVNGVKFLAGCANLKVSGQYTGAGVPVDNEATSGTVTASMSGDIAAKGFATPQDFGVVAGTEAQAIAGALVDQTARLKAWMNSPHPHLHVPAGWYRISESLYNKLDGRIITGDGGGYVSNREHGYNGLVGAKSVFVVDKDDTIPAIRRTRREAPETALDPDDAPISCMLDNQGDGAHFKGFALIADCDFTDMSQFNFGAHVDVGFFNGCRTAVRAELSYSGYFRKAAELWDYTGSPTVGRMTGPDGLPYPEYKVSGGDQCFTNPQIYSAHGGVSILGAKWGTGTYYDYVTDTTYGAWGGRGGSGHSDFTFGEQWVIYTDHHSGFRVYDPTMDVATEDTDAISAAIKIDSRRGSGTQGRGRRVYIGNGRIRTREAARIWLDRVAEVTMKNIHTEPMGGVSKDTSGAVIDITDYTNHSYGPLALRPTSGTRDGAIDILAFDFQGTGVYARFTVEGVPTFSYADTFGDRQTGTWMPSFLFLDVVTVTSATGTFRRVGDLLFCDFTIEYTGANTADPSTVAIGGQPYPRALGSPLMGSLDMTVTTGLDFSAATGLELIGPAIVTAGDAQSEKMEVYRQNGTSLKYNSAGVFQAAGKIAGSFWYRTDQSLL
jgi:hypothetical protein